LFPPLCHCCCLCRCCIVSPYKIASSRSRCGFGWLFSLSTTSPPPSLPPPTVAALCKPTDSHVSTIIVDCHVSNVSLSSTLYLLPSPAPSVDDAPFLNFLPHQFDSSLVIRRICCICAHKVRSLVLLPCNEYNNIEVSVVASAMYRRQYHLL